MRSRRALLRRLLPLAAFLLAWSAEVLQLVRRSHGAATVRQILTEWARVGQTKIVNVNDMPWQDAKTPGIKFKVLYRDPTTGASTMLLKFEPGAQTPLHEHTGLEQTFVIDGELEDLRHEGKLDLIGVSNVGPKMALALLSAMPGDELAGVVAAKDLAKLVAVPGIGKKTAERLLLELKDKLLNLVGAEATHPLPTRTRIASPPQGNGRPHPTAFAVGLGAASPKCRADLTRSRAKARNRSQSRCPLWSMRNCSPPSKNSWKRTKSATDNPRAARAFYCRA
jgi:hypothetical protein